METYPVAFFREESEALSLIHIYHAVCVIDLDTVMPGLVLYDFGDMVRTVTPPTEEEAKQVFVADGVTDGAGFFWSRSIGESDLGILGFESDVYKRQFLYGAGFFPISGHRAGE